MPFKFVTKAESRNQEERLSFNVELVGKPAIAFKKAIEAMDPDEKLSQKEAALQMITFCLKDAGYLKAE
jgi:hypothetical protein